MSLSVAFRAFFAALFSAEKSAKIHAVLSQKLLPDSPSEMAKLEVQQPGGSSAPLPTSKTKTSGRSDALTLLSSLQREARLLDLVYESLDQYSDSQIGAAARDVLRDTRKTMDRVFAIERLVQEDEGSTIPIPAQASPARWRIVGTAQGQRGTLAHAGWISTKIDLPTWNGKPEDAPVIAAAEVETS